MADELTPGQVRARRFDLARKGYDRNQVEEFLDQVAAELEELESAIGETRAAGPALGIDDREALARELHRIGGDVADILEAARAAAEGIRSRASEDASTMRRDAERETGEQRQAATEQSQAMRASAWKEGSAMLAAATAEAQAIIAQAKEEVLFVRAEAEREALRLTGDARRDREETIRAARVEADQMLDAARHESDGMLAAAAQQAEMAQERARALEDRRSELLGELEAARAAIGELESEIESRRQELEAPEEPVPDIDERTHHTGDGGSVRIVSPTRVVPLKPVDAEELVAEVTAMRSGLTAVPALEPDAPVVVIPSEDLPEAPISAPSPSPTGEPADTTADEVTEELDVDGISAVHEDSAEGDEPAGAMPSDAEAAPEVDVDRTEVPPQAETPGPEGDLIGSLFAKLRESPVGSGDEPSEGVAAGASPPSDAATGPVDDGETMAAEPPAPTPAPPPVEDVGDGERATSQVDGASIRAQNEALRLIKRSLVDLQNETLEHLRTDAAWVPTEDFTDRFDEPFSTLATHVGGTTDSSAGRAFGLDLLDAVTSSIERARAGGGGDREVAAAASKVFRMWRSDEAERRVVAASSSLARV